MSTAATMTQTPPPKPKKVFITDKDYYFDWSELPQYWVPRSLDEANIRAMLTRFQEADDSIMNPLDPSPNILLGTDGYYPVLMPIHKFMHSIIFAPTKYGKSTFVFAIVFQLMYSYLLRGETAMDLAIIDLKGLTYPPHIFDGLPMLWGEKRVINKPDKVLPFIASIQAEYERRNKLRETIDHLLPDADAYNKYQYGEMKAGRITEQQYKQLKMKPILLIIEDWNYTRDQVPEMFDQVAASITIWRCNSIYFMMVAQNPDAENMPTKVLNQTYMRFMSPVYNTPDYYKRVGFDYKKDRCAPRKGFFLWVDVDEARKGHLYAAACDSDLMEETIQVMRAVMHIPTLLPAAFEMVTDFTYNDFTNQEKELLSVSYKTFGGKFPINEMYSWLQTNRPGVYTQKQVKEIAAALMKRGYLALPSNNKGYSLTHQGQRAAKHLGI